jgi:hypothetical protein
LVFGLLLGGAVGLLAGALSSTSGRQQQQRPRTVVGGVDLTDVDPTQPFLVDFSVGPQAPREQKAAALQRLRTAVSELNRAFPTWLCRTDASVVDGRFVLSVAPTTSSVG